MLMLTMVSMGAWAQIDVQIANDGKFDGGTIKYIDQTKPDEKGFVTVTITVTPNKEKGYTIKKGDISVYSTLSPSGPSAGTRALEIADNLTLYFKGSADADIDDPATKRDYTFKVPSGFGAWVKEASFQSSGKKEGDEPTRTTPPVEITTDANNKKLYLIQTNAFQSFYIAPQDNNTITTNNILGDYMLWYFLDAGTVTDNNVTTQYYYIVNNSTEKYIYNHNGNSRGISIISSTDFANLSDANKEKCKFKFVVDNSDETTDFYNIDVKVTQTYYGLNKQNGSQANDNPIRLTNDQYIHDTNSKWKFIPYNGTYVWPDPPFTPSIDSDKHFYKIHNVQNGTYYVATDETPDKVIYASTESDRMVWYLKEAGSDSWFKYYYIINPSTGDQYMYYNGTATNGNDPTNAVSVKAYDSENEDRYQFVVVQAARGDGTTRVECYAIIPKLLKETLWGSNSIGPKTISDGANMGIIKSRSANNTAQWTFETTNFSTVCADPTITFSTATGKATISTTTAFSTIHYTTDGSTPSSTAGTEYTGPFDVTEETTINAIVTKNGFTNSHVITKTIYQVATPIIQDNGSNAVSITSETPGATIYYTTDGSNPSPSSSSVYSAPLTENVSGVEIKAIAVKDGMVNSAVRSGTITLSCGNPVFTRSGNSLTISCPFPTSGVSIYYTKNGGDPTSSSTPYTGPISVEIGDVIKAIAIADGYNSSVATKTIYDELTPTDGKYLITSQSDFEIFVDMANTTEGATYHYILKTNVDASSPIIEPFTGVFEVDADANGNFYTITGLSHPLFNTINGGVVKNVILSEVDVKGNGAICSEASGATKIYNCGVLSGIVIGSGNVGGLVGHITSDSSVRVVNCYNFATVSGGGTMAGIVGNNEGTVGDVRIAMCMMYGDMSGGTSPVYAGNHDSNVSNFTEYNYWRSKASLTYTTYNDQLAIDKDDYLTRFPFYRHILNSHRELAAFFLFGESDEEVSDITADEVAEIGHWVLNKDVAPYPIIEEWKKNTRKILDAAAETTTTVDVRKGSGASITSLNVTVKIGSNSYNKSLPITGMDEVNFDYTWGKVVLPFANEFEVNTDYTKICTGWKITDITGGTEGSSFSKYDVSDRDCTSKDLYSTTGFVFAQGGNYIVPYNVTGIEITANFATAYYLSDESYEIGYSGDKTGDKASGYTGRTGLGGSTASTYHNQPVYNSLAAALAQMDASGSTHEQAVVLVGNYHQDDENVSSQKAKGLTIMSIDADNNQEPDYAWYSNNTQDRPVIPPTRFDFIALIPVGMSSRVNNTTFYPGIPLWKSSGWFELTETSLLKMDQFELSSNNFTTSEGDTRNYRCIINGGYFTQMVRSRNTAACTKVKYYQIGGKAYVKEFYPGSHSSDACATILCPINVTGGEIEQCFMTGFGKGTAIGSDIYFWCAGGKIDKFLGAYMEKPRQTSSNDGTVNMTAKIDHAKIGRFFGGGTSPKAQISGNIDVTINNSHVDFYCGGPEFGNVGVSNSNGVITSYGTVTTHATGTTFGEYYGAGFGGTAITYSNDEDNNTQGLGNASTPTVTYPSSFFTSHYASGGNAQRLKYKSGYGIGSCYKFEFIFNSRGAGSVARFYTGYANFDLATTGNVTNELTGCTINNDFYGAGCQGKVNGTVTSTLSGCTINGSAFGGGFKATANEVDVYPTTAPSMSVYTRETGIFSDFGVVIPNTETDTYTWEQGNETTQNTVSGKILYTSKDISMNELGNVTGAISLTIDGGYVGGTSAGMTPATAATATSEAIPAGGNVYGGGNESKSLSDTTVTLKGNAVVYGDVFGGGNEAEVGGTAKVNIMYEEE